MKILITLLFLSLMSSQAYSAEYPETAAYKSVTTGTMINMESETFIRFAKNIKDSLTAEWTTQKTPVGVSRSYNLTTGGKVYAKNLITQRCTVTDIRSLTEGINDPEKLGETMIKQMGYQKTGSCEGAGIPGIEYSSQFGKMCLGKGLTLWQDTMGTRSRITEITLDRPLPRDKIAVPENCVPGPDLSRGIGGMMPHNNSAPPRGEPADSDQPPAPQSLEDAMKMMGDMFKQ